MNRRPLRPLLLVLLAAFLAGPGCGDDDPAPDPFAAAIARAGAFNGDPAGPAGDPPPADLDVAGRVGFWARRYAAADAAVYCFGPAEGGYVAEGRLVLDQKHDCVSLLYRTTELARAATPDEALSWAEDKLLEGLDIEPVDHKSEVALADTDLCADMHNEEIEILQQALKLLHLNM